MHLSTKSFLRIEEHKALSQLRIDGKILDVGGSKKSGYQEIIKGNHKIITGNIDESYDIDVKFDAQKVWPFPLESFGGVLFVNILEHLFDYEIAVNESFRVLKKGGMLAGVVPFMFNVHGSPGDYFRYTRSALERIFIKAGYSDVKILELGSGGFSVIYHILLGFVRWNWLAYLFIPIFRTMDKFLNKIRLNNKMSAVYMPLGYYFECRKLK